MSQIKNGLGKAREIGGNVSQKMNSSVKEWRDEKKKAARVEKKFRELRDQPFEEAAQKFIQDDNLPEPVRAEMKQVVNELEDEEKKEKTLIEMVEKVVNEERMELEELREVNEIERKVDDELEEVAEDEAEAEKFMAEKREKVREINRQMQNDLQSYREALRQGDEARAQKLQQRIGQEMDRLRGTRENLKQFLSNFGNSVSSLLQDARSHLRGAEEEIKEVENESRQVEEELRREEDLVNTIEGESRDEREELSEEQEWLEGHDTTRDEEEEFSEIKSDVSAAAEEANKLDEAVTEEEDEQQNIEGEATVEEEELQTEESVEKTEEQEAEHIVEEGEDTIETIDEMLDEIDRTLEEGISQNEGPVTTYDVLEQRSDDWRGLKQRIIDNGTNDEGTFIWSRDSGLYIYDPGENGEWSRPWLYLRRSSLESSLGKIHYAHNNPEKVAKMTLLADGFLRSKGVEHDYKVDIEEKYNPGGYNFNGHILVIYLRQNRVKEIANGLEEVRKEQGLPPSITYKEAEDSRYKGYQGFVIKYGN